MFFKYHNLKLWKKILWTIMNLLLENKICKSKVVNVKIHMKMPSTVVHTLQLHYAVFIVQSLASFQLKFPSPVEALKSCRYYGVLYRSLMCWIEAIQLTAHRSSSCRNFFSSSSMLANVFSNKTLQSCGKPLKMLVSQWVTTILIVHKHEEVTNVWWLVHSATI